MNRLVSAVVLLGIVTMGCISVRGNVSVQDGQENSAGVLRHVVLFKFKEGSSDADIQKVRDAFVNLKSGIETIRSIESGTDVSQEGLQQGFTHAFIVTFDDAQGRDIYLKHPNHDEFVKLAGLHLAGALVVDFVPGQ